MLVHGAADGVGGDAQYFTAGRQDALRSPSFSPARRMSVDLRRQKRGTFSSASPSLPRFNVRGHQVKNGRRWRGRDFRRRTDGLFHRLAALQNGFHEVEENSARSRPAHGQREQ